MSPVRCAVLTLGPLAILATSYALSRPRFDPEQAAFVARIEAADRHSARADAVSSERLAALCESAASGLRRQLPADSVILVRPPFVVAGNLDAHRLADLHRNVIRPVSRAVWREYCDRPPDGPVVVLALDSEEVYRRLARDLDGYNVTSYAAYYNREHRRIVLNVGTGAGALTHELVHALVQYDFPDLPEWLDEGLASLHEETEFSADGLRLIPQPNWRSQMLVQAVSRERAPGLESLVKTQSFRGEGEGLNYAYVRCLCLYLYERGLLSDFYRKFRSRAHLDPSGLDTLCDLLDVASCDDVDRDFQRWVFESLARR